MGYNDREDRIQVFKDTMKWCKNNAGLKEAVRNSVASQRVYLEGEEIIPITEAIKYDKDANIIVSKKRSFEAAGAYGGQKVALLNFASATNPGGGVERGSSAQEECLCRCSTLYPCISDGAVRGIFHSKHRAMLKSGEMDALYNDDCVYTPGVVVFKTDTSMPEIMPENDWYMVDVITCAAPNLREKPSNSMNPGSGYRSIRIKNSELRQLHAKRTGRILDIAKANGAEVVILGAFGCGAFQNPPETVAAGIYEAVKLHIRDFSTIEFAVFCTPRDTANYDAFKRQFEGFAI